MSWLMPSGAIEPLLIAGDPTCSHLGEEGGRARLAQDRRQLRRGGEVRRRRHDPAHLLGDDADLQEAETQPAIGLGHAQRRPVQPDERGPQLGPSPLVLVLVDGSHQRGWAGGVQHGPRRVAQLQLVVGELEVQVNPRSRGTRAGSP